jgi:tRNA pseudouridine32 synthase/23S rRNA pseudouridine746 synthase
MDAIPEIVYVDDALLVINKPAGLLSIPDGYNPAKPHLQVILEPRFDRLWIVHRLDKDTSGIMVLARTKASHQHLCSQFSNHTVTKVYHAILVGNPPWNEITVEAPLRTNVGRRNRTVVDLRRGKPAITEFRVLKQLDEHTLVEARPKTGRTHQIRSHLYSLGFPILADPLYGSGQESLHSNRLALHAQSLMFRHPRTMKEMVFEAPYPRDFATLLTKLQPKR